MFKSLLFVAVGLISLLSYATDLNSAFVQGVYTGSVTVTHFNGAGAKIDDQTSSCELWLDKGKFADYQGGIAFIVRNCLQGETEFFHLPVFYLNVDGSVSALDTFGNLNIVKSASGADFFQYSIVKKMGRFSHNYDSEVRVVNGNGLKLESTHSVQANEALQSKSAWSAILSFTKPL